MLEPIKHKPVGYFPLDDTPPFQDYSGYNRTGAATGTVTNAMPLLSGVTQSSIFNQAAIGSFDSPVFKQGEESRAFSLEAWLRPIQKTLGEVAQTYSENLAINPSFEVDTIGWSSGGGVGTSLNRDAGTYFVGTSILKAFGQGVGRFTFNGNSITVEAGETYTASVWVFSPSTAGATDIAPVLWGNSVTGGEVRGTPTSVKDVWVRLAVSVTTSAAGVLTIGMGATAAAEGDGMFIDAVLFEKTNVVNAYFDGSMPGYEWSGTPNMSFSRTISNVSCVNLVANPSFDAGKSQWGLNETDFTATIESGALHMVAIRDGLVQSAPPSTYDAVPEIFVKAGDIVQARFKYKTTSDDAVCIFHLTDMRFNIIGQDVKSIPIATDWTEFVTTHTVTQSEIDAGITKVRFVQCMWGSVLAGSEFWIDDVICTLANRSHTYFDGDTTGAIWSGTPSSSASYMLVSNAEQQVLGHAGEYDGLVLDGTKVSFVTKYLNTGECRVDYNLDTNKTIHVVGVHSSEKNALYIDGELVAETVITDSQRADSYITTDGKLYAGETASSRHLTVNGIGIYAQMLSSSTIKANYEAGRNQTAANAVATIYDGVQIPLSRGEADIFLEQTWDKDTWTNGYRTDVDINNGLLVPKLVDGISIAGNWLSSFNLEFADITSIYGVSLTWEGEGAVVEASLDGTTWETAVRGQRLALIPNGFNPTSQILEVRVSFPGGITDDQSWLSNLTVTGFTSNSFTSADRLITLPATASVRGNFEPVQQRDDWGVSLNGGTLTIGADQTANAHVPSTVELWVKKNSDTPLTTNLVGPWYKAVGDSGSVIKTNLSVPLIDNNRIHGVAPLGSRTLTADYLWSGELWLHAPSIGDGSSGIIRNFVPDSLLWDGIPYTVAVTTANPTTQPITVMFDWTDNAVIVETLEPGEVKRLRVSTPRGDYNNTYRFSDLDTLDEVLFRDWIIEMGDTTGAYFDGDTPGTVDYQYTWIGTPHASMSVQRVLAPVGEWSLLHITTDAPHVEDITITGDADIGQVVLYEDVLDTTAMQEIALSYTGQPTLRAGANSAVTIQKPAVATEIYAYDWAIQASG